MVFFFISFLINDLACYHNKMVTLTDDQRKDFETIYNYLRVETEIPPRCDAIVAGGSGTRNDMADRAAELYHQRVAPLIVFSGFKHPKFDVNESEYLAERAKQLGVPGTAIICEPCAMNTGLNIQLAEKALKERGITAKKIVLVHKPYMTRRFLATAEAQWSKPQPEFSVTCVGDDFSEYLSREESLGLGDVMLRSMLKDYSVIKTHVELGYQTPQPLSAAAEKAYQRLINQGFEEQVINHSLSTSHHT